MAGCDDIGKILCGDALETLKSIPSESVDCCITSPPYYGLRNYGCDGQIGLEQTPDEYVFKLVEVFREVRRVLKEDGTLFLNLGDSYCGAGYSNHKNTGGANRANGRSKHDRSYALNVSSCDISGKEEPDSSYHDCSSGNLRGERIGSWWNRISDNDLRRVHERVAELCQQILVSKAELPDHLPIEDFSHQQPIQQSLNAILDQEQILTLAIEQLLSFQESRPDEYVPQLLADSMPKDTLLAFLSSLRSLTACAQEFGYKSGGSSETLCCTQGNALPFSELVDHIRCTYGYYSFVSSWLNLPHSQPKSTTGNYINTSLKPKDLIGIPWMVAFALRADGWYLRGDYIWSKPAPMPESVTDRCTKSHEYLFHLAKSERYYHDYIAIQEDAVSNHKSGNGFKRSARVSYQNLDGSARGNDNQWDDVGGKRNKRSVWTVNTKPCKEAHFAVMPEALIEPCILAGTSEKGNCPACGKAWERVVEKGDLVGQRKSPGKPSHITPQGYLRKGKSRCGVNTYIANIGWRQSCSCILDCAWGGPTPAVVLDPFFGAGTTGLVSRKLLRNYIGIELNPAYCDIARDRIASVKCATPLSKWMYDEDLLKEVAILSPERNL